MELGEVMDQGATELVAESWAGHGGEDNGGGKFGLHSELLSWCERLKVGLVWFVMNVR